ncbi:MAG: hypothetical protein ACLQGP_19250 [Isosphaeraceae bacterium]
MRYARTVLLIVLVAAGASTTRMSLGWGQGGDDNPMEERRLVVVGEGRHERPIVMRVGEILQIRPFSYRVTPDLLGATISVKLEGERVLDLIGQLPTPPPDKEGRAASSVFFLVRARGKTRVELSLVDEEKREIAKYHHTYTVESEG